jgi:hypothetical protein
MYLMSSSTGRPPPLYFLISPGASAEVRNLEMEVPGGRVVLRDDGDLLTCRRSS